ncbi:MAG: type II secretion system protein [Bdellovibrionales bacterium]
MSGKPYQTRGIFQSSGFTLLEVLVALIILTGAIIVVANSWSGNFMRMRKTAMYNNVATLLERQMAEIEAKYKDKPLGEIPDKDGEDFGNDFPNYRWEMESRELKLPDLTPLLVSQEDGANEQLISMMKQMTEFISQTVKEVKVTVFVKSKAKEVAFAATQYFVDYNKSFAGAATGAAAGAAAGGSGGSNP